MSASIVAVDRRRDATRHRDTHPTLQVGVPTPGTSATGRFWTWTVDLASGPTFRSGLGIDVDSDIGSRADPPDTLLAALALVDALSYWKAAVPGRIVVAGPLPGTAGWWREFVARSMAEHLWHNGLDPAWLPDIDASFTERAVEPPGVEPDASATLVLHSGGKDSITAVHLAHRAGRAVRAVSYQPTPPMRAIVAASAPGRDAGWAGAPATIWRQLPGSDRALSCNRAAKAGVEGTWCGRCPKCIWTAAALDAIAGPGSGARRLSVDALADRGNTGLLAAMCGGSGPVPFECAGTPAEVRAVLREIADRPGLPAAVAGLPASCFDTDAGQSLAELVGDLGPAPLLTPDEHVAASHWADAALGGLRQRQATG